MKPSIGRIVHVLVDPKTNNGSDVAPAIITRVWSDECVNLRVIRDNYPGAEEWLTSWSLHESRDEIEAKRTALQASINASTKPGDEPVKVQMFGAFWPPRA
jgi:hypothetical protein